MVNHVGSRAAATWLAGAALLSGLSACGGGGGDAPQGLSLNFAASPLTAKVYEWDLPAQVPVAATVSGSTTASTVYVIIADADGTFSAGSAPVVQTGPDQYTATLTIPAGKATKLYKGELQVKLCADSACKEVLNRSTLPYNITVTENPTLTVQSEPGMLEGMLLAPPGSPNPVFSVLHPRLTLEGDALYPVYVKAADTSKKLRMEGTAPTYDAGLVGPLSAPEFEAIFSLGTSALAAGSNSGSLRFTLCHDIACTKVFKGSSSLPYTIQRMTAGIVTPLAPLAGAGDWSYEQGTGSRSGYVDAIVDPAKLTPRWQVPIYAGGALAAGGKALVVAPSTTSAGIKLTALNENNGSTAWQAPAVFGSELMDMMVLGDRVFWKLSDSLSGFALQAFKISDGVKTVDARLPESGYVTGMTPMGGDRFVAPAYDTPGSPGGVFRATSFSASNGAAQGAPACLQAYESSTGYDESLSVSTFGSNAVFTTNRGLMIANFGAAATCSLMLPVVISSDSFAQFADAPVLHGATSATVFGTYARIYNYALDGSGLKWSLERAIYSPFMAAGNGVVYVWNRTDSRLEAHDESSGAILWTWSGPKGEGLSDPLIHMIVTRNLIFIALFGKLHAIDLATHRLVWTLSDPYARAISANGLLYVAGSGTVTAINLH